MKNSNTANTPAAGTSVWQRLKNKRISYLSIPLLVMAAITEFIILAIGWKYQQVACLPKGMGIVLFGIGPIGATILAVELLKLPLAAWTASRQGWQKAFMLVVGLPMIGLLTFQLVKDMAVYEMGVAMTPASQMLEKAAEEEIKIKQLNGELAAIEQKKADREQKLAEMAAKKAKAKADLEEALKHNEATRQDAITLTDYQKTELAAVEARQATIIQQFNADTAQLNKEIAELRARRETELARATTWNAEEARIENAYKAKLADYTNKKMTYEKEKADYDNAHFLVRKVMREPVHPGVPPEREANTILKPTLVAALDAQINAKEAELAAVNNKRRDRVAQVDADARRLREEFDRRSGTKREETDRKREELSAALAALTAELKAEEKQIDTELAAAVQRVDGIRAEVDAARKRAEGFYEAREAAIKNTQVHRIATTVEIVRGWVFGERPMSITATAKERGDVYTDQISMVRIWVYPVLAFLVAFLPMLMVEVGFSTLFKPEQQRPAHRLGFFGRRMHWLYTRAGRLKILRAERQAKEATAQIAARDAAVAAAKANAEKVVAEKEAELQAAREATAAADTRHGEEAKRKEEEWVAKLAGMADSLNRAIIEKDSLRDLQKSEIERQIQMRQNAWSDRLTQLRQELDDQRAASEAERTALIQEHHQKLMEVTEDCKTQVIEARRQMAAAELAAVESSAKLAHDLKEALHARDTAETQLKHQADFLALQLAQAKEDAAREVEKVTRQEKHRLDRQQLEFDKALRQREEDFEHRLKQREQELAVAFETRLVADKAQTEEDARRREVELERQSDARVREVEARWSQEVQQREEAAQVRLKQREQQLQAQAEAHLSEAQSQAEQELRRAQSEFERQLGAQERDALARSRQELQQKELAFHAKLKQREQELAAKAAARETELQNQWAADLRARQEEMERQAESRLRATETRLGQEAQQQEELFQIKLRQREQQLQAQFAARQAELQAQQDQELQAHEQEWERNAEARTRATEARWQAELQQKEELFQSTLRQRDEQAQAKMDAVRRELQTQTEQELRRRDAESADARLRAVREVEANLRKEMQAKLEAAQAGTKQREQELVAQLAAKTEAQKITEQERDEARKIAFEVAREAQDLKDKLQEASSLLTSWNNGNGKNPFNSVAGKIVS
ncbi:MAG: hypothetical protein PCFJNLEI_03637 [Verrucomicrobiae bacterium]|nr:hypothetical protein [Verrucomicrobiae bacterium]